MKYINTNKLKTERGWVCRECCAVNNIYRTTCHLCGKKKQGTITKFI